MDKENKKIRFYVTIGIMLTYLFLRFFIMPRIGFVNQIFGLMDIIALSFLVIGVWIVVWFVERYIVK